MLRRSSNALLGLSVASLVAAVIGVQLGHSAIAEINPIHFQGVAPAPRAIDPNAAAVPQDSFAQAYGWDEGQVARAYACGGDCGAREARQAVAMAVQPASARPARLPWWRDSTPADEPRPWPPGATGGRPLSVERYMHYPIERASMEADEGEDQEQAEAAEPAEAKVLVYDQGAAEE